MAHKTFMANATSTSAQTSSNFQKNYEYGPGLNSGGYSFGFLRLWIRISAFFGMAIMSLALIAIFYGYAKRTTDNTGLVIRNYSDLVGRNGWLMILVIWSAIATYVCGIGLIRYSKLPDNEFVANKYCMSVLSLTIGGFITPWFLIKLPNVDVKSTQNARVTIVKYFGTSGALASVITVTALLLVRATLPSQAWSGNDESIFWGMFSGFLVLGLIVGAITIPFYGDKAEKILASHGQNYTFYQIVSVIFTIFATVALILQLVFAILRVFAEFARAASANSAFEKFLLFMTAMFQMVYTTLLMYMILQVIKGLWTTDEQGLMYMKKSVNFEKRQAQAQVARG